MIFCWDQCWEEKPLGSRVKKRKGEQRTEEEGGRSAICPLKPFIRLVGVAQALQGGKSFNSKWSSSSLCFPVSNCASNWFQIWLLVKKKKKKVCIESLGVTISPYCVFLAAIQTFLMYLAAKLNWFTGFKVWHESETLLLICTAVDFYFCSNSSSGVHMFCDYLQTLRFSSLVAGAAAPAPDNLHSRTGRTDRKQSVACDLISLFVVINNGLIVCRSLFLKA